jgi:hypothetical protein
MVADNYHIDVTKDFILEVPNAFTPNGDGLNDVLRVIANAGIECVCDFVIVGRNGQVFPEIGTSWSSCNAQQSGCPGPTNPTTPIPITYENHLERVTPTNTYQPNSNRGWDTWDGRDKQGRVLETDGYYWKATIHYKDKTKKSEFKSGMFLLLK